MKIMYLTKESFDRVRKFLEDNQYMFTYSISEDIGQYMISIQD